VAVAGSAAEPTVELRERVELIDAELPRQVFHAAAALPVDEAEALVRRVERAARRCAERSFAAAQRKLAAAGHELAAVALCAEPRDVPTDLARVLANHTLIHSAEGDLYREAAEAAGEWLGVPVLQVDAKRVSDTASRELGLGTDRQQAILADLGRRLGPPWRADHKQATLLAMVALANTGQVPGMLLGVAPGDH
jgi:hypothetical protein